MIAKGKHAKAEKSLCWLRGWVQPEAVKVEFLELIHYNNVSGTLAGEVGIEDDRLISKLSKFKNPAVYRPFRLLMILFFVSFIAGLTPAKPFVCNILTEVGLTEHQSLYLVNKKYCIISSLKCGSRIFHNSTVSGHITFYTQY